MNKSVIINSTLLAGVFLVGTIFIPPMLKLGHSDDQKIETLSDFIEKPVIYLYPEKEEDVAVELDYQGEVIMGYPEYDRSIKGWKVRAFPDGRILAQDGREYSYLFWEGKYDKPIDIDMSTGFVVKGKDVRNFLQTKLKEMGLTAKEYNEFVVYWYPKLKDNEYNLIHFLGKEYDDIAPLHISPEPDSILRVFMTYKPLKDSVGVKEQVISPFERKGFSVVEWGGAEIKK
ncbi:MAG: hypothetical protein PHW52_03625 [Candidatus Pacebacteria bacterium]|nr:hypothetical protein [Candidatus Paceibacterota bacterium]